MVIIQAQLLRSAIGKFHTSSIDNTKGSFQEVHLDFYSYMIDYYRGKFTTVFQENSKEKKLVPNDFEALKKDKEYIQSLRGFLSVNVSYLETLNKVQDEAEQLKENIENYLAN